MIQQNFLTIECITFLAKANENHIIHESIMKTCHYTSRIVDLFTKYYIHQYYPSSTYSSIIWESEEPLLMIGIKVIHGFFFQLVQCIQPLVMKVNENPIMDPLGIQETFDLTPTSFHT